jgi:hypothetical protein
LESLPTAGHSVGAVFTVYTIPLAAGSITKYAEDPTPEACGDVYQEITGGLPVIQEFLASIHTCRLKRLISNHAIVGTCPR